MKMFLTLFEFLVSSLHFQTDRQILTVTLLFACSRDGENSVKGAAVRALAICVLYPSLREVSIL